MSNHSSKFTKGILRYVKWISITCFDRNPAGLGSSLAKLQQLPALPSLHRHWTSGRPGKKIGFTQLWWLKETLAIIVGTTALKMTTVTSTVYWVVLM